MTQEHELRGERIKAHAKMRDEIRNVVKETILKEGMNRGEIESVIRYVIAEEVNKALDGTSVSDLIVKAVKREIARLDGKSIFVQRIFADHVRAAAEKAAAEFVEKNVLVKVTDGGTW